MRNIKSIAMAVRHKAEKNAYKRSFSSDCEGLCGDASIALKNSLKSYGYNAKAFYGFFKDDKRKKHNHCWVEINNDEMIDITATQFEFDSAGKDKVVFRLKLNSSEYKRRYLKKLELKSVAEVSDNYNYSQLVVRKKK